MNHSSSCPFPLPPILANLGSQADLHEDVTSSEMPPHLQKPSKGLYCEPLWPSAMVAHTLKWFLHSLFSLLQDIKFLKSMDCVIIHHFVPRALPYTWYKAGAKRVILESMKNASNSSLCCKAVSHH
jgi:hypothetical protein